MTIDHTGQHVPKSELESLAESYHADWCAMHEHRAEYIPTPEDIKAGMQREQAGWSDKERHRRAGYSAGRPPRVEIPTAKVHDEDWQ